MGWVPFQRQIVTMRVNGEQRPARHIWKGPACLRPCTEGLLGLLSSLRLEAFSNGPSYVCCRWPAFCKGGLAFLAWALLMCISNIKVQQWVKNYYLKSVTKESVTVYKLLLMSIASLGLMPLQWASRWRKRLAK